MAMKNPLTQPEIEPATFRFVAQRLNRGYSKICKKEKNSLAGPRDADGRQENI